jgi:hypothetical protein
MAAKGNAKRILFALLVLSDVMNAMLSTFLRLKMLVANHD